MLELQIAFLDLLAAGNAKKNVATQSQVILTSSIAGVMRDHPSPEYVASKAALTQVGKVLSTHFAHYSIRVNSLAPGWFRSEMTDELLEQMFGKDSDREGAVPTVSLSASSHRVTYLYEISAEK